MYRNIKSCSEQLHEAYFLTSLMSNLKNRTVTSSGFLWIASKLAVESCHHLLYSHVCVCIDFFKHVNWKCFVWPKMKNGGEYKQSLNGPRAEVRLVGLKGLCGLLVVRVLFILFLLCFVMLQLMNWKHKYLYQALKILYRTPCHKVLWKKYCSKRRKLISCAFPAEQVDQLFGQLLCLRLLISCSCT